MMFGISLDLGVLYLLILLIFTLNAWVTCVDCLVV